MAAMRSTFLAFEPEDAREWSSEFNACMRPCCRRHNQAVYARRGTMIANKMTLTRR